ncbi:GL21884 [Drosophila persimilis]|uniref:GL21884 n=1 Tax=Drosophila persimilis TaxID=7234 RepID=B4GE58_DROPE|nr:GL21884 [Drosophila persimilis]
MPPDTVSHRSDGRDICGFAATIQGQLIEPGVATWQPSRTNTHNRHDPQQRDSKPGTDSPRVHRDRRDQARPGETKHPEENTKISTMDYKLEPLADAEIAWERNPERNPERVRSERTADQDDYENAILATGQEDRDIQKPTQRPEKWDCERTEA